MRLVCALLVISAATVHADSGALQDMLGPREIAVGEALRGGATGASAISLNPSGLPLNQELVFEGGYGYRPSDQASLIDISACDSTTPVPGCFYYDYAGASPDLGASLHTSTNIVGTTLGYPITPRVTFGTNVKYFHFDSDVMNQPSNSGINFDLGTTLRLTDIINIGVSGQNLWGSESTQFPRAIGGGMLARPLPILTFSFDARWKLVDGDHSARYGGGAELFLRSGNGQTGYALRGGALHDAGVAMGTTYLSAGVGLAGMKFGIDLAARKAVSGTDETLFIASMRFYGPRLRGTSVASDVD